ncbi:putative cytochrome, mitochondrial [Armadillidium vulgare]|nr:putative cytochrome, mitochondrial [Armadillidium vulgare]
MAFSLTRFQLRKSWYCYKNSFNIINVSYLGTFDSKESLNFWGELKNIYGPTFRIKLIGEPDMIVITNPDDIENSRITMKTIRSTFFSLKKIRDEAVDNFFEKKSGILAENYEEWHRVRSRLQTPMMRPKNIVRYLEQMDMFKAVGTVALNRRLGCLDRNLSSDSPQMKIIDIVSSLFELMVVTETEFPWWRYIPSPSLKKLREKHDILLSMCFTLALWKLKKS